MWLAVLEYDFIRSQLPGLSDDWWPIEAAELPDIARRILEHAPSIVPVLVMVIIILPCLVIAWLLQATYLDFYGRLASCCDWWIVDEVLHRWINSSYEVLKSSGLCPVQASATSPLHGLPAEDALRNLVTSCLAVLITLESLPVPRRGFGDILHANPDAVLHFRSHSFQETAVRRRFLIRLQDMGIAPHQLQPLPYAPSSAAAMADYGRIHLHFDTFPVSGTTTTLDSLAMGIPVLTCPTPYYAGAISAAILEHAGLADHVCPHSAQLPSHARWLADCWQPGGPWLVMCASLQSMMINSCTFVEA